MPRTKKQEPENYIEQRYGLTEVCDHRNQEDNNGKLTCFDCGQQLN
jgi:hypothetical protein